MKGLYPIIRRVRRPLVAEEEIRNPKAEGRIEHQGNEGNEELQGDLTTKGAKDTKENAAIEQKNNTPENAEDAERDSTGANGGNGGEGITTKDAKDAKEKTAIEQKKTTAENAEHAERDLTGANGGNGGTGVTREYAARQSLKQGRGSKVESRELDRKGQGDENTKY